MASMTSAELREYCKVDPDYPRELDDFEYTPLMSACLKGRTDLVHVLLEFGADPNYRSSCGSLPLTCAVPRSAGAFDRDLFDTLLDAGAEINNSGYETPLHSAVLFGQREVVRYLVERGGDPNLPDGDLSRPLHAAGAYGRRYDAKMIRLLVEIGADPELPDLMGKTLGDYLGPKVLKSILRD